MFISPLSLYNLSGCGLPLLGDIKHLLEKQASGFAFLFLLLHRVPGIRSLDDLCSCFGVVWINGSMQLLIQLNLSPLYLWRAAAVFPLERLNLAALVQQSPSSGGA